MVDIVELLPDEFADAFAEEVADGHQPPTGQQHVSAGAEIVPDEAFLSIFVVGDHQHAAVQLVQVGHHDLQHLAFLLKVNVQLLDGVVVVEDVEAGEVEEHADGGLEAGGVVLFGGLEGLLGEVGQSPVVKGAGYVVEDQAFVQVVGGRHLV